MKPVMTIYINKCMFSFWEFWGILGIWGGLIGPSATLKSHMLKFKGRIKVVNTFFCVCWITLHLNSIVNHWQAQSVDFILKVSLGPRPPMLYGQSDGWFLLYGAKFQDGCFDFLSYHFLICHNTVSTSANKWPFLCTICRLKDFTHLYTSV